MKGTLMLQGRGVGGGAGAWAGGADSRCECGIAARHGTHAATASPQLEADLMHRLAELVPGLPGARLHI